MTNPDDELRPDADLPQDQPEKRSADENDPENAQDVNAQSADELESSANAPGDLNQEAEEGAVNAAAHDSADADLENSDEAADGPADEDRATEDQAAEDGEFDEEGLPEWEPLTPELVEDEAIRGDFMLRWAIVLLAFLFGFTEIEQSQSLVHIKTGQYLASHGILPPANDVFSYTATDRPWVNLPWLFDLTTAAAYSLAGVTALTLLKSIIAAFAFYFLVHNSKPNVSSWWGSVVAALTLVACSPQFTLQPEVVTLLGLSLTLWLLYSWLDTNGSTSLWWMVLLAAVWSNFDNRAFFGPTLIILYAAGESLGAFLGKPTLAESQHRRLLWTVSGLSAAALMINPFGWQALLAPMTMYGVEYPILREYALPGPALDELQYFSMLSDVYWRTITPQAIAGVLVPIIAMIGIVLNRNKVDFGEMLVLAGFMLLAIAAGHEIAAACLVATVIGTRNAQSWYRDNFRQTYSIETSELLFSRGGRAVTVLAMFALAFMATSGRLWGRNFNRVGVGFNHALKSGIDGLGEQLTDSFDDRPFNFVLSQGDLLIWLDQKVFIDSRVAVYAGEGDQDIVQLHDRTRRSLRERRENQEWSGNRQIWIENFNRFNVTHVLPRLSYLPDAVPDYRSFFDLLGSPDWELTNMGPSTGVFYRTDIANPELAEYRQQNSVKFISDAFRKDSEPAPIRTDWARAPGFYQRYLSLPQDKLPAPVQEAAHYRVALSQAQLPMPLASALAYQSLRKANVGLAEDPNNPTAYRILASVYGYLRNIEDGISRQGNVNFANSLRYYQTLSAYHQALRAHPNDPDLQYSLAELCISVNKQDLALQYLEKYDELTQSTSVELTDAAMNARRQVLQKKQELYSTLEQVEEGIAKARTAEVSPIELAQQVYQAGFVLKALELVEEDQVLVAQTPAAQRLRVVLLLEVGRLEEAAAAADQLEQVAEQSGVRDWRTPVAYIRLANGEYDRAIALWRDQMRTQEQLAAEAILRTLPLVQPDLQFRATSQLFWPTTQVMAVSSVEGIRDVRSSISWNIAICQLESGQNELAKAGFLAIIEDNPETHLRPLLQFYIFQLANEVIDVEPPSNRIPVSADMFVEDAAPEEESPQPAKENDDAQPAKPE